MSTFTVEVVPVHLHLHPHIENWRRHRHVFEAGENVIVTEKIHGANARYCFDEGRMHAAAHSNWK